MKNNSLIVIALVAIGAFGFYQLKNKQKGEKANPLSTSSPAMNEFRPSTVAPPTGSPSVPPSPASHPTLVPQRTVKQDSVVNAQATQDIAKIVAMNSSKREKLSESEISKMNEAEAAHKLEADKIRQEDLEKLEKRRAEAQQEEKELRESKGHRVIKF